MMDRMDRVDGPPCPCRPFRPPLRKYIKAMKKHHFIIAAFFLSASALALALLTHTALLPSPDLTDSGAVTRPQLLDRHGRPMTVTYQNQWNLHDVLPLHQVPAFLQQAFVFSEDRRFFHHHGVDWPARLNACRQNLLALSAVRGASTISEQVVRMLHPRPRSLWARWLEGFEARRLEKKYSKAAILEWYLNQVPYAARRRGVRQAARYYFGRDPATLSLSESLALVVMVRAPGIYDPSKDRSLVERRVWQLGQRMHSEGVLTDTQWAAIENDALAPAANENPVDVRHFAGYVAEQANGTGVTVQTTLDLNLQQVTQLILDQRLDYLHDRQVDNGAVLVADHHTSQVRAWVVGHCSAADIPGVGFDAVRTLRQPGSTLKPFVYALALAREWTAATMIEDAPLNESVLWGLHTYHNYSRVHYGPVSLREALGSSLNIPAIRAIQYVGADTFLSTLRDLGIQSLDQHPNIYGDGLALGNGAVSLFELVQAYGVLARRGRFAPLQVLAGSGGISSERQVFSDEVASLMGHILSDPQARRLEFSENSLLDLPIQTAVKTGTSSGYRDAWAVGYDHRHVVGVWMGNLDNRPMDEITGAAGPVLVLRAVFAELNRHRPAAPLYFSRRLESHGVCIENGQLSDGDSAGHCAERTEWFIPGKLPQPHVAAAPPVRIHRPTNGLQMALDPRIPDAHEAFEFRLNTEQGISGVDWFVDGRIAGHSDNGRFLWSMQRGNHQLQASIRLAGRDAPVRSRVVRFVVK